jgi:uncharacterized protein YjiS (DUF1127 family)
VRYVWLIYPAHLPEQDALPTREPLMNRWSVSGTLDHHAGSASLGSGLKLVSDFLSMHIRAGAAVAWRVMLEWERRRRSRQMLRSLSLREIRDFSLDVAAAEREARKPFWRA